MKIKFDRLVLAVIVLVLVWGFVTSFNQSLHGFLVKRYGDNTKTWLSISIITLIILMIVIYVADLDFGKITGIDVNEESE